jgi:hypothetical protein
MNRKSFWLVAAIAVGALSAIIFWNGTDNALHMHNVNGVQCVTYKDSVSCDWNGR